MCRHGRAVPLGGAEHKALSEICLAPEFPAGRWPELCDCHLVARARFSHLRSGLVFATAERRSKRLRLGAHARTDAESDVGVGPKRRVHPEYEPAS
jgi:hypothetical protein